MKHRQVGRSSMMAHHRPITASTGD